MRKYIFFCVSALLTLSCERQASEQPGLDLLNIDRPAVRVCLGKGDRTVWEDGDEVSVFYRTLDNEKWQYLPFFSGGDVLSRTHIERNETTNRIVALYPYQEDATLDGDALSVTLPATQRLTPASFAPDAALMTAVSETESLHFHYAAALLALRLNVADEDISYVTLSGLAGEIIAGAARIDLSTPAAPALSLLPAASGTSVTLQADPAVLFATPAEVLFCLPPMTSSSGVIVEVGFADGTHKTLRWDEPITVSAGRIKELSWGGGFASMEELVLDFNGGKDPFDKSYADTLKALSNYTSNRPDYTFYLKHGSDYYPFTLHAGPHASSYGFGIGAPSSNPGQKDLQLGRGGSYITIPPMAGKTLYSVSYVAGSTSGKPVLCSDPAGLNAVSTQVGTTEVGEKYTMLAYLTEEGKTYYMVLKAPDNFLHALSITVCYR